MDGAPVMLSHLQNLSYTAIQINDMIRALPQSSKSVNQSIIQLAKTTRETIATLQQLHGDFSTIRDHSYEEHTESRAFLLGSLTHYEHCFCLLQQCLLLDLNLPAGPLGLLDFEWNVVQDEVARVAAYLKYLNSCLKVLGAGIKLQVASYVHDEPTTLMKLVADARRELDAAPPYPDAAVLEFQKGIVSGSDG